jgi:predicted RNA-binding Zn-ribbon protein involved in translation (DUF1610 family)
MAEERLLKWCNKCDIELQIEDLYCYRCGSKLELRSQPSPPACPLCGSEVRDRDEYCRRCGAPLSSWLHRHFNEAFISFLTFLVLILLLLKHVGWLP